MRSATTTSEARQELETTTCSRCGCPDLMEKQAEDKPFISQDFKGVPFIKESDRPRMIAAHSHPDWCPQCIGEFLSENAEVNPAPDENS